MEEMNNTNEVKIRKMKELKNGRSKLLPCNYSILENIFIAKGLNHKIVAEELGYERGYFTKVKARGAIGETCVKLLEQKYGIMSKQYIIYANGEVEKSHAVKQKVLEKLGKADNPNAMKVKVQMELSIDKEELSQIIKEAVLEAFNSL